MFPRLTWCVLASVIVLSATAAYGRQSGRAYRTLFGPGDRDDARADQLTLTSQTYSGFDDTTRLSGGAVLDDALQSERAHQGATIALNFGRRRSRLALTANGQSAVRYYHSLGRIGTQKHSGGVGATWRASRSITLRASQDVAYSPTYQLNVVGLPAYGVEDTSAAGDLDYDLYKSKQFTYTSFAGARYVMSTSREINVGYGLNYTDFLSRSDFGLQQASARFTQRLTSGVALRLGYGIGSGTPSGLKTGVHHDLDIGLALDRSFSISPRTIIGFTSGSTLVSTGQGRQFELVGSLQLQRRLSPRWSSSLSYQRGLTSVENLERPLIANTFGGDLSGFLGAQTRVSVRPVLTWGADVVDASRSFHSISAVANLQTAISRHWAVYGEYVYYGQHFASAAGVPETLAGDATRSGLRAGIALWKPIER